MQTVKESTIFKLDPKNKYIFKIDFSSSESLETIRKTCKNIKEALDNLGITNVFVVATNDTFKVDVYEENDNLVD